MTAHLAIGTPPKRVRVLPGDLGAPAKPPHGVRMPGEDVQRESRIGENPPYGLVYGVKATRQGGGEHGRLCV